jgi:peptide/nickel transport system permease protein
MLTKVIIGHQPILCKYKSSWYEFLFTSKPENGSELLVDLSSVAQYDYRKLNYDFVIWPLINLDAKTMNSESAWLSPFSKNNEGKLHLLGTYDLGKDTLAGCLYGLHKSLLLSILTILISGILGVFIGSVFSFQSQRFEKISAISIVFYMMSLLLFMYTIALFVEWKNMNYTLLTYLILVQFILLVSGIYFHDRNPQWVFRLDFIGLRYIEIMKSIPVILILLILLQIIKNPGVLGLAIMISIIYIPIVAKYARAFTLSASHVLHIDSTIALGQTKFLIYVKHVLPKVLTEILPVLAFGVGNIILLEASLSFLGLGLALDEISLGTMMFAARGNPSAWWVVVFPGLLVFWLVATFNTIGGIWSDYKATRDFQT